MNKDSAETGNLKTLLSSIGASLDQFQKFEHPDAFQSKQKWLKKLDIPLPQKGVGIKQVTRELAIDVIANGSPVGNPFITTGATTAAVLATTASSIASPQRYLDTAFNFLEELSLNWLTEMFSIGHMKGVYSSGGSVANLIALGGARQYAFEKIGIDPAANGIDRPVSIYASMECHHTIQRSGGVLGIGRRAIKLIECDSQGRMKIDALLAAIEKDQQVGILPMAIVANAGTTNTGAIDPLLEIGEIAKQKGIWFHVDGAYGLPGILDERVKPLYEGLQYADSVIIDPHKWLGTSVGVAATFVRDREYLLRAFTQEPADYLEGSSTQAVIDQANYARGDIQKDSLSAKIEHSLDDFGIPYFDYGVELSAPCRGVAVWAMLREIGVEGMRARVIRHNDMAKAISVFAKQHPNLEVLLEPTLSICCFRYFDERITDLNSFNQQLHRRLIRENLFMPSTTKVNGQLVIRPCYVGARHLPAQVDGLLEAILRIGNELLAS
ncbi:pyridoxal phosphate-dependent decarboxylase family protein [Neptunomonas japonica]|uniref:pyridoxal phosphate-dependent decarboxylase family protein n=1 Tax=Neptunomonas japonica TaxID=417574 RepID=UPI000414167D|nr:aminotransferase class V-fold PLP-dependent enzyme [Neptunomonas japonica]